MQEEIVASSAAWLLNTQMIQDHSKWRIYSWFPKGQMVPEFEDFSFNKEWVFWSCKNYGFHIIQVLGKKWIFKK